MAIEQRIGRIDRIGQQREVFVFNLVTRGTLEEQILHLLDEKISMFELVVGEVGAILGGLEEDRDFADLMLDAWLHTTEASRARGVRRARPPPARGEAAARERQGPGRRAVRRRLRDGVRPRPMSELREFVADLLERQGAAVEALGPDELDSARAGAGAESNGLARAGAARLRNRSARMARLRSGSRATGSTGSARCSATRDAGASGRCGRPLRFRRRATRNGCSIARSTCRTRSGASRACPRPGRAA